MQNYSKIQFDLQILNLDKFLANFFLTNINKKK